MTTSIPHDRSAFLPMSDAQWAEYMRTGVLPDGCGILVRHTTDSAGLATYLRDSSPPRSAFTADEQRAIDAGDAVVAAVAAERKAWLDSHVTDAAALRAADAQAYARSVHDLNSWREREKR